MDMPLGRVVVDVEGTGLTGSDRLRLVHPQVGGVILFSRNFASVRQLRELCADIRALRSPALPIAVDHEGGRVQRFREGFTALPAPGSAAAPRHWREVLNVPNTVQTEQTLKDAYRRAASAAHPDKGGSDKAMAEVNAAYEQAKQELGYA